MEDMAEQNVPPTCTSGDGGFDVKFLPHREGCAARDSDEVRQLGKAEGNDHPVLRAADHDHDHDCNHDRREDQHHVGNPHHNGIGQSTAITNHHPNGHPEQ